MHHPGGCFVHPLGVVTLLDHPIEVFPNICFILGLKSTVNAVAAHTCIKLCHCRHSLHACMSSDGTLAYYYEGFPHW